MIGYRDEERVDPESGTETYAALRLEIENWRWAGVPIYLRAGKRMKKRATEIGIQFKQPPLLIFNRMQGSGPCNDIQPNLLTIRIQPDEGIALRFGGQGAHHAGDERLPCQYGFRLRVCFRQIQRQRL